MTNDPVCGMEVDEAITEHKYEFKGEMYYFCSPGCKSTFEGNPEKYIRKSSEREMETPPMEKKKPWWKFW